jgi:hypothetical protein
MKARLENYHKSVWKGKESGNTEYYGLRGLAAALGKDLTETSSTMSATTRQKKLNKEKEAERIQAKPKITPSVYETLDKKEEYEKKLKEAEKFKLETEKRYKEVTEKRDKIGTIKDQGFLEKQHSITATYADRALTNPNLLDKQEELRRIKSEFDDEKLQLQKQSSSQINQLEKLKGLSFKSKSTAPQFLPTKEDIMVERKEARDLIFTAGAYLLHLVS